MKYPEDFPSDAQAAVEAEEILANEQFKNDQARLGYGSSASQIVQLIRAYVARVTLAFAKQACDLGRDRLMTVVEIRSAVDVFLQEIANAADAEKRFYADGTAINGLVLTDPYSRILPSQLHHITALPEWKEYQQMLLGVANIQRTPLAFSPLPQSNLDGDANPNAEVAAPRQNLIEARSGKRKAFVEPILRRKGMTASQLATKAGFDPSVIYDYLSGKSRPRPGSRNEIAEVLEVSEPELPD